MAKSKSDLSTVYIKNQSVPYNSNIICVIIPMQIIHIFMQSLFQRKYDWTFQIVQVKKNTLHVAYSVKNMDVYFDIFLRRTSYLGNISTGLCVLPTTQMERLQRVHHSTA